MYVRQPRHCYKNKMNSRNCEKKTEYIDTHDRFHDTNVGVKSSSSAPDICTFSRFAMLPCNQTSHRRG
jgi:hypothetical protein